MKVSEIMKSKIIYFSLIIFFSFALFSACKNNQIDNIETQQSNEITIPVIFLIDAASNIKNNEDLVNEFNEEYKGKYRLEVDWLHGTASTYRSKIKMLNVVDELPAIVTDIRFSPSFYQLLIDQKRLVNLKPYLDADDDWRNSIEAKVLEACLEDSNSIYLSPSSSLCFSYSGVFWNKDLFKKVGISSFPKTWQEFWNTCDILLENDITPLSLHTDGTAWAPMLFSTALLGTDETDLKFIQQRLPNNYINDSGKKLVSTLKKLFMYTTKDAINSDFDIAFEHFFNGETAMLPNGYWTIEQIDTKWQDKIGFDTFPQNVMIASADMSGWAISSTYDKDIQEGAVLFLKYRTKKSKEQAEEFLYKNINEKSKLELEFINAVKKVEVTVPNYQLQWNQNLQDEVLSIRLPELINNNITEDEFLEYMNYSIKQIEKEQ